MSLLARLNRTTRKTPAPAASGFADEHASAPVQAPRPAQAMQRPVAQPVHPVHPVQPVQPVQPLQPTRHAQTGHHAELDMHELVLDDFTPETAGTRNLAEPAPRSSEMLATPAVAEESLLSNAADTTGMFQQPEQTALQTGQDVQQPGNLPPLFMVEPESPAVQVASRLAEIKQREAARPVESTPVRPAKAEPVRNTAPADIDEESHDEGYYLIKAQIHERLIEMLDLTAVDALPPAKLREEISRLVEKLLREEFRQAPLNGKERRGIVKEIQDEVLGLGPLEPLLQDPTVSDILVNNYRMIYVERHGKLQQVRTRFKDDVHLRKIIDRIVAVVGRRVDEASPMVDARLMDGSRVNAIIPPLALDGPSLSIRRFSKDPLELTDLINYKALTPEIGKVLEGIVKARLNVIVSGGTGSGKTTMLNCLSRFVPHDERIVTIEDAAELQLKQDHVVRLETRPANIEGSGEVNARDLVKNCLRMRPDRIIVGEVRSSEVLDMLQAMNTGHDGSLTTIHANNPRDCLMRLETMVAMSGLNIASASLKRYIASAVDVIIQVNRLSDGSRKLVSLQEVTGMEGDAITMQEIFCFKQTGLDENRKVIGQFICSGIRPKFSDRLLAQSIELDPDLFDPTLRSGQ
ncbi:MAG: ATPase, T2SS/T4P/T4SS family [Halodesulfovibrio sp.]